MKDELLVSLPDDLTPEELARIRPDWKEIAANAEKIFAKYPPEQREALRNGFLKKLRQNLADGKAWGRS